MKDRAHMHESTPTLTLTLRHTHIYTRAFLCYTHIQAKSITALYQENEMHTVKHVIHHV